MKHRKLITSLASILLLLSGIGLVNTTQIRVNAQTVTTNEHDSKDFNAIKGHDDHHPIWPVNHLGVFVESDSQELQDATKKACAEWSPAFTFHYKGELQSGQSMSKLDRHDSDYIIIKNAILPHDPNDSSSQELGVTHVPSSYHGWFVGDSCEIDIDLPDIDSRDKTMLQGVVAHELGHAIGLRHSNNSNDCMYWETSYIKSIQPEELALVQRLYDGHNYRTHPYPAPGTSSNVSHHNRLPINAIRISHRLRPNAVLDKITNRIAVANNNDDTVHFVGNYNSWIKRGRKNYTNHSAKLANGTYRVIVQMHFKGLKRRHHGYTVRVVSVKGDSIMGDYGRMHVPAHSRRANFTAHFLVKVKKNMIQILF